MTTPPNTPPRWRPRFSVRTLVVIVTLVCAYAACWRPTKRTGVKDVLRQSLDRKLVIHTTTDAAAPLLVAADEQRLVNPQRRGRWPIQFRRSYYFWFFGYAAKLPYERELPPEPLPDAIFYNDYVQ